MNKMSLDLLPKSKEQFSQKKYWDTFFKKRGKKSFEWYGEYPELCGHLHKYVNSKNSVLMVGCGNSTLSNDLYDVGYKYITNIDISPVVIQYMSKTNAKQRPEMKFLQMDATNMSFINEDFDTVIDKGTLDALMPDDKTLTINEINKYFGEIERVLSYSGSYICISLLQEHILNKLIDYFHKTSWLIKLIRCHEVESKVTDGETVFPVFMIVCTKIKTKSSAVANVILELSPNQRKMDTPNNIKTLIANIQQATFLCSHLKNTSIVDVNDAISFDVFNSSNPNPRYTVHMVDIRGEKNYNKYAAFIVPQGREAEWLFSTNEGRKELARMSQHIRLAVITMHRNQVYANLEDVKKELNEIVQNLAPAGNQKMIPFLTVSTGVGNRMVRYMGNSKCSGEYVIEDVTVEQGEKYRRLYYLQSQMVIQSEAKLKTVKSRTGKTKEIADPMYLTCKHHVFMSLFALGSCEDKESSVAVIGLGGGGLCTFLRKLLPKAEIKAVDVDEDMLKIATEWFGFQQDGQLQVDIMDGLLFLEKAANNDSKYNAVLFDVDSKDTSIGMSCPPMGFLEEDVINNVIESLSEQGIFILNLVIRDTKLRLPIMEQLKKKFKSITFYKLEKDLNEVVVCFKEKQRKPQLAAKYKDLCDQMNNFMKSNGLPTDELIDTLEFMQTLKIQ